MVTGYCALHACVSFTMKALLHQGDLERHRDCMKGHFGYVMIALWLCCASQERRTVSAVPEAPRVSFQPLSSRLACPRLCKQCSVDTRQLASGTG